MAITRKQRIAMGCIVAVGIVVGGAVVLPDRRMAGVPVEAAGEDTGHGAADRVTLSREQVERAGITVATAGPATFESTSRYPGEIRFDEDRTAHVVPRAAGVVESVPTNLGQHVRAGQVMATISSTSLSDQRSELLTAQKRRDLARSTYAREKQLWEEKISARQDYLQAENALQESDIAVRNASQKLAAVGAGPSTGALNRFDIRAPFAGTVVEKHITLGEVVREDARIFTVADLTSVWTEFVVSAQDLAKVRVGRKVTVTSTAFEGRVEGTVSYVGSLLGEQTRTAKARVTLNNPDGAWRPGLFVTVVVAADRQAADVAIKADAVQTIDGKAIVFVVEGDDFVARPVKLGRNDGATAEIVEGLKAGEAYAASNTFVLKADLGKAGVEHGH